jgi:hypothetical protein
MLDRLPGYYFIMIIEKDHNWPLNGHNGFSVPLPQKAHLSSDLPPAQLTPYFSRLGNLPFLDNSTVLLHRGEHYPEADTD